MHERAVSCYFLATSMSRSAFSTETFPRHVEDSMREVSQHMQHEHRVRTWTVMRRAFPAHFERNHLRA